MPLIQSMQSHAIAGSTYGFSATRIGDLGAAEFTLAVLAADTSGSVGPFLKDIETCIKSVASACLRSPRADNLMLRVTRFDNKVEEVHGFKPLGEVDPDDYQGCLKSGGCTALYDAAFNAIESTRRYGRQLTNHDFDVNGIVFVITDGCDNVSKLGAGAVKKAIAEATLGEDLESLTTLLVGVNISDSNAKRALAAFSKSAAFTKYIDVGKADAASLARLADFVSRSISLQSRSLGRSPTAAAPALTF